MSIDFFLLNRKCSQKLLTKFSHAEVCFFTEIPGKRLLYHQVSPVSRRGWGWWIQCFDSTGVRVGNSEKSLQYSWLLANRLLQSIVHVIAIYWHLMHHFNKKNTNIEKKQTRVFVGVFYVKKKKKRSTYIQHSHVFFPSKFGAWRSLLPYAAVGLEFPGWNGPQLHSCTDVARCQRSERWDPHGFGGKNPWEQKYMLEIYIQKVSIYISDKMCICICFICV